MNDWAPPHVDAAHDVPLTSTKRTSPWWHRRYRRVPMWGWGVGALAALTIGAAIATPQNSGGLAIADVPAVATAPHRPVATTTAPPTTRVAAAPPVPATTVPATTPVTTVPATTIASTTTVPPTTTTTSTTTVPPTTTTTSTTTVPPTTTTLAPATTVPAIQPLIPQSTCDPNYTGCVPIDSDVDCAGGSGNGPSYATGPVNVIGTDIYGLDHDGDGIACE